jgi:methylthioribose-1-phosphate isomerase
MRTVVYQDNVVRLVDQTALPSELRVVECGTVEQVADAIERMVVRGAPAIGVTAAFGMVVGAHECAGDDPAALLAHLERVAKRLKATRPTAVNLAWAVDRMLAVAREAARGAGAGRDAVERVRARLADAAQAMADADVLANRSIGAHGAALVPAGARILTHCNTGSLATVEYGTALGVVRAAAEAGKVANVLVDETRPFLQGARLTAWELQREKIPLTLIADNMAGYFMARGEVDLVVVGADRIAANGDVANKIGTYSLAVLCAAHDIPFYVAAPTSTIDLSLASGAEIPIEQRAADEVTRLAGVRIAPEGVHAAHPAFDVTPARYVAAIVTEVGVHRAPYERSLRAAVEAAERAGGTTREARADAPLRA